jgi:hypothetical protein
MYPQEVRVISGMFTFIQSARYNTLFPVRHFPLDKGK